MRIAAVGCARQTLIDNWNRSHQMRLPRGPVTAKRGKQTQQH
jgi:hypothetical protein